MGTTLEQILGYAMQTASARSVAGGVNRVLPPAFYTPTMTVPANTVSYHVFENSRKGAQAMPYGAASRSIEAPPRSTKSATLWSSTHNMSHQMSLLMDLKRDDRPDLQRNGEQEISRKTVEFARFFGTSEANLVHSCLFSGYQYWTSSGDIVLGSSGSSLSLDYEIPARNINRLGASNNVIATKWDTASADIRGDMQYVFDDMNQTTGRFPSIAVFGKSIPGYFLKNTILATTITANNQFQNAFAQPSTVPAGFLGIPTWINGSAAYYQKADGTLEKWLADDELVIMPDFSTDWYEVVQGTTAVQNSFSITNDAVSMINNITNVAGLASWCTMQNDPPSIKQIMTHNYLPILKVPACVYRLNVDF